MANETTLTTLNDLIAPIVQEAMFVATETSIMPGLVKNFSIPANSGKVLQRLLIFSLDNVLSWHRVRLTIVVEWRPCVTSNPTSPK